MKTKHLGCISAWGGLAALITLLIVAGVGLAQGGVLFSPGALSRQNAIQPLGGVYSHAEIGGRCAACHVTPWSQATMATRCLECHTSVMLTGGLHASLLPDASPACRNCHPEHRGPQAELTLFDPANFPHDAVGFSLSGHELTSDSTEFRCDDCHLEDIRSFDQAWCQACHRDIRPDWMAAHTVAFGEDCLACHDGVDRYGPAFDHANLEFSLTGRHSELSCGQCHVGARTSADLRSTPQDCYSCHQPDDQHRGQFGQDCAACHSTSSWQHAVFDHSQTGFPLTGKHLQVDCQDCHINQRYQDTPADCYACHVEDDAHQSEFGQDCAACHTPDGWQDAAFDHSLAPFPLAGAHLQVACSQCHLPGDAGRIFKGTPQECRACHIEPEYHSGLFRPDCAACHSDQSWAPARYDGPHGFPVNHGESGPSACRVCHPDRLHMYDCYGCHEHNPVQIQNEHREEGITQLDDCVRCHPSGREEGEHGEGGDDD